MPTAASCCLDHVRGSINESEGPPMSEIRPRRQASCGGATCILLPLRNWQWAGEFLRNQRAGPCWHPRIARYYRPWASLLSLLKGSTHVSCRSSHVQRQPDDPGRQRGRGRVNGARLQAARLRRRAEDDHARRLEGQADVYQRRAFARYPRLPDANQEVQRRAGRAGRQGQRRDREPRSAVCDEPLLRRRRHQEHARPAATTRIAASARTGAC